MNVNFTGIQQTPQLKQTSTTNQQITFQATHKPDTVSFGNAKVATAINESRSLLTKVINFVMEKGKAILELVTKLLGKLKGKGAEGTAAVKKTVDKVVKTAHDLPRNTSKAFASH